MDSHSTYMPPPTSGFQTQDHDKRIEQGYLLLNTLKEIFPYALIRVTQSSIEENQTTIFFCFKLSAVFGLSEKCQIRFHQGHNYISTRIVISSCKNNNNDNNFQLEYDSGNVVLTTSADPIQELKSKILRDFGLILR